MVLFGTTDSRSVVLKTQYIPPTILQERKENIFVKEWIDYKKSLFTREQNINKTTKYQYIYKFPSGNSVRDDCRYVKLTLALVHKTRS